MYHAIFESHLLYSCLVLAQNINSIKRLYILQKKSLRLMHFLNRKHIQPLSLRIPTYSNFLIKLPLKIVFLLGIISTKPYQHLLKIGSLFLQIHIPRTQDGLI